MALNALIQNKFPSPKTSTVVGGHRKPTKNSRAMPCRVCKRILPLCFYPSQKLENPLKTPFESVCQTCHKLTLSKEERKKNYVRLESPSTSSRLWYWETSKSKENLKAVDKGTPVKHPDVSQKAATSAEKPFPCPNCEKRFGSKQSLRIHSTVHTGEKPYGCAECGKCFRLSQSLVIHRRVHTGEKPYECAVCGKWFRALPSLYSHRKTHAKGC